MDLNDYDLIEMRMAAEKAQLKASPHSRALIAIDADKVLWLLEAVKDVDQLREEETRRKEQIEECSCVRTPPYDGCAVHE